MTEHVRNHWNLRSAVPLISGALIAISLSTNPASADGFVFKRGLAVGENAGMTRSKGFASTDNGFAARSGGCLNVQVMSGCRQNAATRHADGTVSARSASQFSGENRAFSGNRSLDRDADGNVSGNRAVDASGINSSYSGASSLDDGVYKRDGTYTGDEGQSATVNSVFERGSGGSRSVTCIDASGAVVDCP